MTGAEALSTPGRARARRDFDRGARQQRRPPLAPAAGSTSAGPAATEPARRRRSARRSGPTSRASSCPSSWRSPSRSTRARSARYVFTPPHYQDRVLRLPAARLHHPAASRADPRRGRRGVQGRSGLAEAREAIAEEGAALWVLNGSGRTGRRRGCRDVPRVPRHGRVGANQKPDTSRPERDDDPRLQRRGGRFPLTIAALERSSGRARRRSRIPPMPCDFIIITARRRRRSRRRRPRSAGAGRPRRAVARRQRAGIGRQPVREARVAAADGVEVRAPGAAA